jgi:hypothetical protein
MILCALLSLKVLDIFSPFSLADYGITLSQPILINVNLQDFAFLIGLIFIHELMHLVFIPDFLTSDKVFIGITYFGGFAYSEEILSKSKVTLILIAPFVVISILLPGILDVFNLLNPLVKLLILLNGMSSGADMLSLILILTQVPEDAYLTCNGMKTYWKRIDKSVPGSN